MMFDQLSPDSRVWVYTADRNFTEEDKKIVSDAMSQFLPQWAAHGNALFGDYAIESDRFLILAVDESKAGATGCSIDTSVRFVKELGAHLSIDFFNRLNMILEVNNEMKTVHISELKNYPEAMVFNPMITKLSDLRVNWRVKVADSPFV